MDAETCLYCGTIIPEGRMVCPICTDQIMKFGTLQQTKGDEFNMTYERLLEIARKMHTWIFLNSFDEFEVYDELGITDEENIILGSCGKLELQLNKEGE